MLRWLSCVSAGRQQLKAGDYAVTDFPAPRVAFMYCAGFHGFSIEKRIF